MGDDRLAECDEVMREGWCLCRRDGLVNWAHEELHRLRARAEAAERGWEAEKALREHFELRERELMQSNARLAELEALAKRLEAFTAKEAK